MAFSPLDFVPRGFPAAAYFVYASRETLVRPCPAKKIRIYELDTPYDSQATFQYPSPKNSGSSAAHTGPILTDLPLCSARSSRIAAAKPGKKRVEFGAF
jgi:hypothetical protein